MYKYRSESRTSADTSSKLGGTGLKWKAFLFSLMLFVLMEIAIIMYAGLNTNNHVIAAPDTNIKRDVIAAVRRSLGLSLAPGAWDLPENDTSWWNETVYEDIAIHNDSIAPEHFAVFYEEMCELYFIPRTIKADASFTSLFAKIVENGHNVQETADSSNSGLAVRSPLVYRHLVRSHNSSLPASEETSPNLPPCPCVPKTLVGQMNVTMRVPYLGEVELSHPDVQSGGLWHPRTCLARHRTAIIIPFRDREEHLTILLKHLHQLLQNQMLYYRIFVVEQAYPAVFNKASIMNVGFREATQTDSFDCFIFHDVDMIPENDYNFYTCTPLPRHVGSHCDKFGYHVPYPNLFGGVTAFTMEQFQRANGFSNEYYGWGGEDDDMFQRIIASNMNISRFPSSIARYTMIKHGADAGNPYNSHSYVAWTSRPTHYKQEGLNTLKYYRREAEDRPLYTWSLVELPDPRPPDTRKKSESNASACHRAVPSHILVLIGLSLYSMWLSAAVNCRAFDVTKRGTV